MIKEVCEFVYFFYHLKIYLLKQKVKVVFHLLLQITKLLRFTCYTKFINYLFNYPMLKTVLFACFFIFTTTVFAQDSTSYLKPGQFKINALLVGGSLSYEQRVSNVNTIVFEGALQYGFIYQSSSYNDGVYKYNLTPVLSVEGRHYYHFKERLAKQKKITNNSSNFWSLQAGYMFKPIISKSNTYEEYSDAIFVIPSWGIQRSLGKSFSLELLLGVQAGYKISSDSWGAGPATQLKIGYIIK